MRDGAADARDRLGGVLQQVLEDLEQLVGVAGGRRQRGVEVLGEAGVRAEAGLGGAAGAVQHVVDVERAAVRRAQVAELLDPVDQLADARRLGLDQPGQLAVAVAEAHLEQLRRAGDAGERVADLVGEHRGHAGHRARRGPVAEAAIHLFGHALGVHQDQDLAVAVLQRGRVHVLQLRQLLGPADHDVVLRYRDAVATGLADDVQHRAVGADEPAERLAGHLAERGRAEAFRRGVGRDDAVVLVDHQRRVRDGAPEALETVSVHAATRAGAAARSARPRASAVRTAVGSVMVRIRPRSASAPGIAPRYQPRCLRATRSPRSGP